MGRALAHYIHSFTGFGRDARLFLLTTLAFGAAIGLYWIDFNLYLESIGIDPTTIGLLMAASQLAGVVVAFPASALSTASGVARSWPWVWRWWLWRSSPSSPADWSFFSSE